jgi:hypothetical protein
LTASTGHHWSKTKNPAEAKVDAEKPDGRVLLADLHTAVLAPVSKRGDKNFGRVRGNDFLFV